MTELSRTARILYIIVAVLAIAGVTASAISLQRHYAKSATTFCDFSQQFNCDIVNRSEWSEIAGVPVAGIGLAGYIFLFILSTFRRAQPETPRWLFFAALAGTAFALYLTYIEAYELMTWCILCVASQIVIFVITVLAGVLMGSARKS
ncbi:MAG TPA: vitamin K epoxide reductase family protein [Candidatus Acidoferrum sp.]|nr:vitamin K epoxide reductase family protein [Candidatus Acidoferrum sp.]